MKTAAPPAPWARPLALCVGLLTLAVAGCEAGEAVVPGLSEWRSAGAAERPWRAQAPVAAAPDVEARRVRALEELSQWGSVSPDGRLYVAQLSDGQIGIRDLESGEIVRPLEAFAFDGSAAVHGFGPVFSPDGRRLAFASLIEPAGAATDSHGPGAFLWILDLEAAVPGRAHPGRADPSSGGAPGPGRAQPAPHHRGADR